jgi:hypothetical protein
MEMLQPYGVDRMLVIEMLQNNLLVGYEKVGDAMVQLRAGQDVDYSICSLKESEVQLCLDALYMPRMAEYGSKRICSWYAQSLIFNGVSMEMVTVHLPYAVKERYKSSTHIVEQCLVSCIQRINNAREIVFRTEDERRQALSHYAFPEYISHKEVADIVSDRCVAFELYIRPRISSQARQHNYYPVRYVKLNLPE